MERMKRQKRDMTERAYAKGYQVGVSGKSKDLCPDTNHDTWMSGWRDGRADNWDGFTGISGLHKQQTLNG
jgi:ribosome modulation factor